VRRAFEFAADIDDHQIMTGILDLTIGQPTLAKQLRSPDLEIDKVVGVMKQAHAVRFGVANPDGRLGTFTHAKLAPD
jgi:hypothetical protein